MLFWPRALAKVLEVCFCLFFLQFFTILLFVQTFSKFLLFLCNFWSIWSICCSRSGSKCNLVFVTLLKIDSWDRQLYASIKIFIEGGHKCSWCCETTFCPALFCWVDVIRLKGSWVSRKWVTCCLMTSLHCLHFLLIHGNAHGGTQHFQINISFCLFHIFLKP